METAGSGGLSWFRVVRGALNIITVEGSTLLPSQYQQCAQEKVNESKTSATSE